MNPSAGRARSPNTPSARSRRSCRPSRRANVLIDVVSVPAVGSVTAIAWRRNSPLAIRGGSYFAFAAADPWRSSVPCCTSVWPGTGVRAERWISSRIHRGPSQSPRPDPAYSCGDAAAGGEPARARGLAVDESADSRAARRPRANTRAEKFAQSRGRPSRMSPVRLLTASIRVDPCLAERTGCHLSISDAATRRKTRARIASTSGDLRAELRRIAPHQKTVPERRAQRLVQLVDLTPSRGLPLGAYRRAIPQNLEVAQPCSSIVGASGTSLDALFRVTPRSAPFLLDLRASYCVVWSLRTSTAAAEERRQSRAPCPENGTVLSSTPSACCSNVRTVANSPRSRGWRD